MIVRVLCAFLAIAGSLVVVGCGEDSSQKAMVDSQKRIDEANAKLEGRQSGTNVQRDDP